ncbi:MAG: GCG_CRPN prefix-to-repeats domain-containing protein [Xanthobacteraceae bacterium]
MRRFLQSTALAVTITVAGSTAQAFPAPAQIERPTGDIVQVRGFCGLGWHRGPYGGCYRNGALYAPYVYGPYAAYAPPYPARCWWTGAYYGARRVCAW